MTDDQIIAQVEIVLAEMRPAVQMHGGDIELVKVNDRTVYVRLTGACIGCPASIYTMKLGIEQTIKDRIPNIDAVIQV